MKALSIRQPWAWLIINGAFNKIGTHEFKDVENRCWYSDYRGRLYIHASKTFDWDALIFLKEFDINIFYQVINEFGIIYKSRYCDKLKCTTGKFGGIIGYVEMTDCVKDHNSGWFFGPYGFVLENAKPLPFFQCPGRLNFFDVDCPDK